MSPQDAIDLWKQLPDRKSIFEMGGRFTCSCPDPKKGSHVFRDAATPEEAIKLVAVELGITQ